MRFQAGHSSLILRRSKSLSYERVVDTLFDVKLHPMATTTQHSNSTGWIERNLAWYRELPKALGQHQLILFTAAIISIVFDQATKWWVEANIPLDTAIVPIEGYGHILDFLHVKNPGAAFGTGQQFGWVFATVAFVVTAGIIFYNTVIIGRHVGFRLSLGLIMGGALGNVIDRFRIGEVTDFIHFDFRPWATEWMVETIPLLNFAIFNLADLSIFSGVLIMFWLMWKDVLPEDPWLDEVESNVEEIAPPLTNAIPQNKTATQLARNGQTVPPADSLAQLPLVNSGVSKSFDRDVNWRRLDEENRSQTGYGLLVGLLLGIAIVGIIAAIIIRLQHQEKD